MVWVGALCAGWEFSPSPHFPSGCILAAMHVVIFYLVNALWLAGMILAILRLRPTLACSLIAVSGYGLLPVLGPLPLKAWLIALLLVAALVWGWTQKKIPKLKLAWWDLPMLAWAIAILASEISNDRPVGAMIQVELSHLLTWVIPYLAGRAVFRRPADLRDLASAIVWLMVFLAPLSIFESLVHPPLHQLLYGQPLLTVESLYPLILNKWGPLAYRPSLFFDGAQIASSFFFAAGVLLQLWLMLGGGSGNRKQGGGAFRRRPWDVTALLLLTVALFNARAFVGLGIFAIGSFVILGSLILRTRFFMLALLLVLPVYVGIRAGGYYKTPFLVGDTAPDILGKNRSLFDRLFQEDMILQYVKQRPVLGYGSSVRMEWKNTGFAYLDFIDGYWDWTLMRTGWLGLVLACQSIICPLVGAMLAVSRRRLFVHDSAPGAAIAVVVALHFVDWIFNPNINVVWAMGLGAAASVAVLFYQAPEVEVEEASDPAS